MSILDNTRSTIDGFKVLLEDDFSSRREVEDSVKNQIDELSLLDDDAEAVESVRLYKNFLSDIERHSKKLNKLELKEKIYEDTLETAKEDKRDFILGVLKDIKKDKHTFS